MEVRALLSPQTNKQHQYGRYSENDIKQLSSSGDSWLDFHYVKALWNYHVVMVVGAGSVLGTARCRSCDSCSRAHNRSNHQGF